MHTPDISGANSAESEAINAPDTAYHAAAAARLTANFEAGLSTDLADALFALAAEISALYLASLSSKSAVCPAAHLIPRAMCPYASYCADARCSTLQHPQRGYQSSPHHPRPPTPPSHPPTRPAHSDFRGICGAGKTAIGLSSFAKSMFS